MCLPLAFHAVGDVGIAFVGHNADESERFLPWSVAPASRVLACVAED
jgi:hypothetical protein